MLNSDLDRLTGAQTAKNLSAMQETRVWSLDHEDPLEKGRATHTSILAWRISRTEEPGGLQSMGLQRVRHDWVTKHRHRHTHTHTHTGWTMAVMVEVATRMRPVLVMLLPWRHGKNFFFFFFLLSMGRSILMRNIWKVSQLFLYPVIFIPFTNQASWLPP